MLPKIRLINCISLINDFTWFAIHDTGVNFSYCRKVIRLLSRLINIQLKSDILDTHWMRIEWKQKIQIIKKYYLLFNFLLVPISLVSSENIQNYISEPWNWKYFIIDTHYKLSDRRLIDFGSLWHWYSQLSFRLFPTAEYFVILNGTRSLLPQQCYAWYLVHHFGLPHECTSKCLNV